MKMNISNCINHKDKNKIKNELENLGNDFEINYFFKENSLCSKEIINENIIEDHSEKNNNIEDINICNLLEDKNRLYLGLLYRLLKKVSYR